MVGCRHNAKNTLDKNYLYFAEKRGAKVFAETRVIDVRPRGAADGTDGYELTVERSTAWLFKQRRTITCRQVVLSGSALGTMDLLMRCKQRGSLPAISDRLGTDVRTNAESIVGVRFPGNRFDLSKGIAIGSGIHIDQFTHIEATRYSAIDTRRVLVGVYLMSSLLCFVAACLMMARFNSASAGYAQSYLLVTILAAVLGGVDPFGGFGRVAGLVMALLVLQVISSGLNQLGLSQHLTLAIWGLTLIGVMAARTLVGALDARRLLRAGASPTIDTPR